jgi:phage terminase large subunit-like protein
MPLIFTDKQQQALALIAKPNLQHIMLYGGSRSGKTFVLCWALHQRALHFAESRHAILRWRFNHLKQSVWYDTMSKVVRLANPEMVTTIKRNKSDWVWRYPNDAEIWFGGLDDEDRVDKILGNEYATLYLNECSQISQHARETAMTRLAQKIPNLDLKMLYDCNPASMKHWTYRDFVSQPTFDVATLQMNPKDNLAHLPEHYIGLLQRLPPRQRERFLHGKFLADVEGALWQQEWIDTQRISVQAVLPKTARVVVGVDPSITGTGGETGIIVAAFDGTYAWVLEDCSLQATPDAWARAVVGAVKRWHADAVVAEVNQGGELVTSLLRHQDPTIRVVSVRASKGKLTRAEPISALYEQGRVRHRGEFILLEEQMTHYTGALNQDSPDRMDALVWALTELFRVDGGLSVQDASGMVLPSTTGGSWW